MNEAVRFTEEIGLVPLGTVVAAGGAVRRGRGSLAASGRTPAGRAVEGRVEAGRVVALPIAADETASLSAKARRLKAPRGTVEVRGGEVGLLLDARGRPPAADAADFGPLPADPPAPRDEAPRGDVLSRGPLRLRRELPIPGRALVEEGEEVGAGTVLARSERTFPRPFFLNAASELGVEPDEVPPLLAKRPGAEVAAGEELAVVRGALGTKRALRAPVAGRLERVLPDGRIVVREHAEPAPGPRTIDLKAELGRPMSDAAVRIRVEEGREVLPGQALAQVLTSSGLRSAVSPIRGRVERVDPGLGRVVVVPLVEELEVTAGIRGAAREVSDRGAVVESRGLLLRGLWGRGGEAAGRIAVDRAEPGAVAVLSDPGPEDLEELARAGAAGLVTGGLPLLPLLRSSAAFPVLLVGGFGRRRLPADVLEALTARAGRPALLDGRTELRAGVRRPTLVVPDGD